MDQPEPSGGRGNVVGFGLQERRLGPTVLRTYRSKVDIDDVIPNERQPRLGPKEDEELQRQIEVTDRTLTDEERLRVWIYIHRQRKEWDAREKEMVAYRLVDLMGRASAANILGISMRELDKLVEIYELSARFTGLRDPAAAITWARELT